MRPRTLLSLLLLASTLSAAEVPLGDPLVLAGSATYGRRNPVVVAGDGFLVAWEERAFGIYPGPLMVRTYDDDGVPRQQAPIAIAQAKDVRAVWTGSEYLLVYAKWMSRFGSYVDVPAIVAVRIRPDGTLVESSELVLAEARSTSYVYQLAWNGSSAMAVVVYESETRRISFDTLGRITENERLTGNPPLIVSGVDRFFFLNPQEGDAAAVHDGTMAIVENTSAGVVVTLKDSANGEVRSGFMAAPGGRDARAIAWDRDAWVMAYVHEGAVCTARFTGAADVVRTCNGEAAAQQPMIAAGRARTFTVWSQDDDQVLTDAGLASTFIAAQLSPAAVRDAAGLLVAWTEGFSVRLGGLAQDGTPRPVRTLDFIRTDSPARLASAGELALLVWTAEGFVHATRLDAQSNPIPPVVRLGAGAAPAIASNGREWLVAWVQGNEIVSTLLSMNLDANGLQHFGGTETMQRGPAVAATAAGFLVVWSESEASRVRVVAEPLDAGGLRVSGGVRLLDRESSFELVRAAVGCSAERCLVAWDDMGVVVQPNGQPVHEPRALGSRGAEVIVAAGNGFQLYAGAFVTAIAADGTPLGTQRWMNDGVQLGAVLPFRGRTTFVYSRDSGSRRVFALDAAPRGRGVRH